MLPHTLSPNPAQFRQHANVGAEALRAQLDTNRREAKRRLPCRIRDVTHLRQLRQLPPRIASIASKLTAAPFELRLAQRLEFLTARRLIWQTAHTHTPTRSRHGSAVRRVRAVTGQTGIHSHLQV